MKIVVAPLAGARIEILDIIYDLIKADVAPLAGARIEIIKHLNVLVNGLVAPLAGARIEIVRKRVHPQAHPSLPSRERGLKYTILHIRLF